MSCQLVKLQTAQSGIILATSHFSCGLLLPGQDPFVLHSWVGSSEALPVPLPPTLPYLMATLSVSRGHGPATANPYLVLGVLHDMCITGSDSFACEHV